MSELESLFFHLVDQRSREYTLFNAYGLKAKNEKDPIARVIYQKLSDDSSSHMWLVEIALKIARKKTGQKIPKLTMVEIAGYDLTKNQKKEIPIDEVDITLEEMEAASAALFSIFASSFPDANL